MRTEGYSRSFRDHYLVPFASALWSTAPAQTLSSPASYAVRFFQNHGLLGFRRHTWRTVVGGSRRYVTAIIAPLGERLRLGAEVRAVTRDAGGVEVRTADDRAHRFDAVVIATHAPQALAMLATPTTSSGRFWAPSAPPSTEPCCTPTARCSPAGAPAGPPGTTRWPTATPPRCSPP